MQNINFLCMFHAVRLSTKTTSMFTLYRIAVRSVIFNTFDILLLLLLLYFLLYFFQMVVFSIKTH